MENNVIAWIDIIQKDKQFMVCESCCIDGESVLADVVVTELDISMKGDSATSNIYLCANHVREKKQPE